MNIIIVLLLVIIGVSNPIRESQNRNKNRILIQVNGSFKPYKGKSKY